LNEKWGGTSDLFCSMKKNYSKILIFDAGIGYDAMDDFFIESSNHMAGSGSTHHHMKLELLQR